jgi:SAM-dependent methyltransferase
MTEPMFGPAFWGLPMSTIERCDFDRIVAEERPQAKRIAEYLRDLPHTRGDNRILDVGCGPGIYVEELRAVGFDAYGIDNDDRLVESQCLRRGDITKLTVFADTGLVDPFHIALCLEVGEHLQPEDAMRLVEVIMLSDAKTVYFSAARPGQGGEGHINCQPKSYWSFRFHDAGFYLNPEATEAFLTYMRKGYHMGWLAHPQLGNGMVFERC